jgi:hypothetical protein
VPGVGPRKDSIDGKVSEVKVEIEPTACFLGMGNCAGR